jgi:hypothetical protein
MYCQHNCERGPKGRSPHRNIRNHHLIPRHAHIYYPADHPFDGSTPWTITSRNELWNIGTRDTGQDQCQRGVRCGPVASRITFEGLKWSGSASSLRGSRLEIHGEFDWPPVHDGSNCTTYNVSNRISSRHENSFSVRARDRRGRRN